MRLLQYLHAKAGIRTTVKYRTLFGRLFDLLTENPGIGAPRLGADDAHWNRVAVHRHLRIR